MEQKSKTIGTTTYLVTQMDAISCLKIQTKLIKVLGEGVFSLVGNTQSVQEKAAVLLPALMNSYDDELVNEIVLALFEKGVFTEVNGQPKVVDFSTHFIGKPKEMWQVAMFILEANLNLGELSGLISPTTPVEEDQKED